MSASPEYVRVLNDLNKEVQRQQPRDILQFCSNYFLAKLEAQRKAQWSIEPKAKELGLQLFPQDNQQQAQPSSSSPSIAQQQIQQHQQQQQQQQSNSLLFNTNTLQFKQPFTNDDPHSKHFDDDTTGIFKSNFEVGEENKSIINSAVDPISEKSSSDPTSGSNEKQDFATANAFAAAQARRSSHVVQSPLHHNIPSSFNANRRTSVSAETLNPQGLKDQDFNFPVITKSENQLQRLSNSVVKNFLFSSLDEDSLKTVINALKEVKLPQNTEIIRQGDEGDYFYVVEEGSVDFYVNGANVNSSGPGSSFGELALMYNSSRAATAIAKTDVVLWALDRLTFRKILLAKTSRKRSLYESFLKEVPVLSNLSLFERSKLADALDTATYKPGDVIIKEGEVGENFYLIEIGEADVVKESQGVVSKLTRGDYFGEVALLNDLPRQASVIAQTEVRVATLDKRGFQRLLGPAVEVLKRQDPTKH